MLSALSALSQPLLTVSLCNDIDALAWAKLQLNLANSINALVNRPVKSMLLDKQCREVIALAMEELLVVAAAKGLTLPRLTAVPARWLPGILRLPDWLFSRVASKMLAMDDSAYTSMWWDIQNGRITEIDYLNGALVSAGQSLNIPCPVNQQLVRQVKLLQTTQLVASRAALDGYTLKNQLHLE